VTKTFAELKAGMQAEVGGTPASKGVMVASTVNTGNSDQQEGSGGSNTGTADISGVVVTVGAASFTAKGEQGTVTITVSNTTTFVGVKGLADLKAGMRVEVKGTKQSNGFIAAQQVTVGHGDS
jgi:hypothetical protein